MLILAGLLTAAAALQPAPQEAPVTRLKQAAAEQKSGDRLKAIALYRGLLETPEPPPVPGKAQFDIRALRGEAQWGLAVCLEDDVDAAPALEAYREARTKWPRVSFCGNGVAQFSVEALMGEGRCLERLGRHDEAVDAYFRAVGNMLCLVEFGASGRVVELYDAAGRLGDLSKELDRRDREITDRLEPEIRKTVPAGRSWYPRMRELLGLRLAARAQDWEKLIDALQGGGLLTDRTWNASQPAVTAAHLLASRPEKTVPLLQSRLDADPEARRPWIYYALSRCRTPEALAVLRERAALRSSPRLIDLTGPDLDQVLCALDLAGDDGRAILREYRETGPKELRDRAARVLGTAPPVELRMHSFPAIPKDLRLK